MTKRLFSKELESWAAGKGGKTLGGLIETFQKDSFAIIILLLMSIPALPIPTGGVTHVFEIITALLALELVIGRTTIWLPKRWRGKSVAAFARGKFLAKLVAVIKWFERFARPRLARLMNKRYFLSVAGLLILIFTASAFLSPPFSGLDTLPSLGVVILCLSLIFDDIALFIFGILVGAVGIGLIITLGSAIFRLL